MEIQDERLVPEPTVRTEVGCGGMVDHGSNAAPVKSCFD